jgi:hypothetical protein
MKNSTHKKSFTLRTLPLQQRHLDASCTYISSKKCFKRYEEGGGEIEEVFDAFSYGHSGLNIINRQSKNNNYYFN